MILNRIEEKYPKSSPRYTSYPPVPYWKNKPDQTSWLQQAKKSLSSKGADLYVHIPYCQELCYYCGCFKTITKKTELAAPYTDLLWQEWSIYLKHIPDLKIHSLHFGGGSPTFLPAQVLSDFLKRLHPYFTNDFIGSFEIDPRTVTSEHLKVLKDFDFKRLSLGIQDFDPLVQHTIHRNQSYETVESLVKKIREMKFESLNFDLIYGLPKQTLETVKNTLQLVKMLNPDLLSIYHYAHLPERIPSQKLFKEEDLPDSTEKQKMWELIREQLRAANYQMIGMDHYAKKSNYLAQALDQHHLHRNFMGYTDFKTDLLIGLGVSSISSSKDSYIQNSKDFSTYEAQIKSSHLAIDNGHTLSAEDKRIDVIIKSLMCYGELERELYTEIITPKIKEKWNEAINDQLVIKKDHCYQLTELGMRWVRPLCALFDPYLASGEKNINFSQN